MSVIYVLIPIAILFTAVAIYLFFWAVKSEQFDDLEKEGMSILFDDEPAKKTESSESIADDSADDSVDKSAVSNVVAKENVETEKP